MKYDNLVKRVNELLPDKKEAETKRFKVPKVKGRIQGNKTIITNLKSISDYLDRSEEMVYKYLIKEFGTKAIKQGNQYVFTGRFPSGKINEKIKKFVKEYVTCKECGKPDTKLIKQDRIHFIKCMACGAKYPIKL